MKRSQGEIEDKVAQRLPRRALMRGVTIGGAAAMLAQMGERARAADAGPFPDHPKWSSCSSTT